ncbi:MAG TPA: PPOX class F420-dependent oxidoreductase [Phycisphaerales bacterium]|nr:PPOX class F420-dependent oxidoreductase [Phycisphaerales bacterium]
MSFSEDLMSAEYINLVTFRKSGKEVPTPVWAAPLNGSLYAFSEGKAGKVKRLRNSPKCKIATCTYSGTVTGEWAQAEAVIVEDPAEIENAYQAFYKKYGLKVRLFNLGSKLIGKFSKRAMLKISPA